jgi:hypothetical protein
MTTNFNIETRNRSKDNTTSVYIQKQTTPEVTTLASIVIHWDTMQLVTDNLIILSKEERLALLSTVSKYLAL